MAQVRIYVVIYKDGSKSHRLVEAASQAQAIRHVVDTEYTAKAATSSEVASAMSAGATVEKASSHVKAEPEVAAAQPEAHNEP